MNLITLKQQAREEVANEIRAIANNLEAMYGRVAGMTAWYDSLRDHADNVEKGKRYSGSDGTRIDSLIDRVEQAQMMHVLEYMRDRITGKGSEDARILVEAFNNFRGEKVKLNELMPEVFPET